MYGPCSYLLRTTVKDGCMAPAHETTKKVHLVIRSNNIANILDKPKSGAAKE